MFTLNNTIPNYIPTEAFYTPILKEVGELLAIILI